MIFESTDIALMHACSTSFPQLGILNCTVLVLESSTAGLMALDRAMASTVYSAGSDTTGFATQLAQKDNKPTLYGVGELQQQVWQTLTTEYVDDLAASVSRYTADTLVCGCSLPHCTRFLIAGAQGPSVCHILFSWFLNF